MKTASALIAISCLAASSVALTPPPEPDARPKGKPAPTENFDWTNPFSSQRLNEFEPSCSNEKTFEASDYLLDDLQEKPPLGLWPYFDALKKLLEGRQYPGSWDGIDPHGYDRNLIMMAYNDVPIKVREWIEDQERTEGSGKGLFAVYERPADEDEKVSNTARPPAPAMAEALRPLDQKKIVLFAPGAVYDILPLWVAEGSQCEGELLDTKKYSSEPADGGVIAWTTSHTKANRRKDERNIKFTVKAQVLKNKPKQEEKSEQKAAESSREEVPTKDEL